MHVRQVSGNNERSAQINELQLGNCWIVQRFPDSMYTMLFYWGWNRLSRMTHKLLVEQEHLTKEFFQMNNAC